MVKLMTITRKDNNAMYSEAQKKATAKYQKKTYDDVRVRVPKGYRDEVLAKAAQISQTSVNDFIRKAVEEKILRDGLGLPIDEYKP